MQIQTTCTKCSHIFWYSTNDDLSECPECNAKNKAQPMELQGEERDHALGLLDRALKEKTGNGLDGLVSDLNSTEN